MPARLENVNRQCGLSACRSWFVVRARSSRDPLEQSCSRPGTDLDLGNPLVTIHPLSRQVQRFVLFTTLARYDSALAPEPYAAKAWAFSADKRDLTFHLVTALRWHDGTTTTARDVAFTPLLAARDPKTGYARAGDLTALDTVITPDDSTAVLHFVRRNPTFRSSRSVDAELPILRSISCVRCRARTCGARRSNLAPVGNGPFKFVERVAGQRWVFARNDGFPASSAVRRRSEQLVIASSTSRRRSSPASRGGDLDFAGIAPTMAALAQRRSDDARARLVRCCRRPASCSTRIAHDSVMCGCAA